MIFNMTGGGKKTEDPLNFTVVGGTSQPSSPKENTIWVSTSTTITSWVFSAEQPTSPNSGMVWIQTKDSSDATFNALKKNILQVYPQSAKQYVSYSWVDKESSVYQNNGWKELSSKLYLFDSGDECEDITGGWIADNTSKTGKDFGAPTITITDTLEIYCASGSPKRRGSVYPANNYIDFSKYKTLYVKTTQDASSGECMIFITSKYGSGYETGAITSYNLASTTAGMYAIDVSAIGYAYFYISTVGYDTCHCYIKEIYLE